MNLNVLVDLEAGARSAGVSYATVRRWVAAGKVAVHGKPRSRMVWTEDLQEAREKHHQARRAGLRQFSV